MNCGDEALISNFCIARYVGTHAHRRYLLNAGYLIYEIITLTNPLDFAVFRLKILYYLPICLVVEAVDKHATVHPCLKRYPHDCTRYDLRLPHTRSKHCLLYTSPSPRDRTRSRMPSSA